MKTPQGRPPQSMLLENHTSAEQKKAGIGLIFESTKPGYTSTSACPCLFSTTMSLSICQTLR